MWVKECLSDGRRVFVTDGNAQDQTTEIRVYDFLSGEHTDTIPLPERIAPYGDRTLGLTQDGKLLMYSLFSFGETDAIPRIIFYCNISDIGTEKFQWYEVKPVN